MSSKSGTKDNEQRDDSGDSPWETQYEKLWVEVEKKEVMSSFKMVAAELKERFGEMLKSQTPTKADTTSSAFVEEDSSDEGDGEVIVRPMARARSIVLLTIPEQMESGLEDSAPESTDYSRCGDRTKDSKQPAYDISVYKDDRVESSSKQHTTAHSVSSGNISHTAVESHSLTTAVPKFTTSSKDNKQQSMDSTMKDRSADLNEPEKSYTMSEEDPREFAPCQHSSLSRCPASIPGVSEEELDRFKVEVGILKVVYFDLENEKTQLLKKVANICPSHRLDCTCSHFIHSLNFILCSGIR